MNIRSLRFKLSLTNGIFISVFFVSLGYVRYPLVSYRAQREFENALARDADFLARNIRATPQGADWIDANVRPSDVMAFESVRPYFILTDPSGQVLGQEIHGYYLHQMMEKRELGEVLRRQSGFADAKDANGRTFRFVNLVLPSAGSAQPVVLHLGRSLEPLSEVLREYLLIYVYSVPLVLVISAAVGWFLAGHALKPFEEVARTAEQITSERLNTQIVDTRKEEEVQRLVQAFNSMVARLSQSFNQMRKFNANVAHELRTPLAILQGENEIALRSPALSEDIRTVLISNLEELGRLTRIVNDMLTLSEAEAGAQVLDKKPINFRVLLGDLAEQMQLLATERNVQIEVQELPDVVLEADDLWMRRAVLNLIDNAIKYSRDGGTIWIGMHNDGNRVRISIRDEGIGISGQDIPYIFDPMFRTDPARNRHSGGAGLGLALVKWVVEAHAGRIHVLSEPDRGAEFQIDMPLQSTESRSTTENREGRALKAVPSRRP